jgi:pimeloyl-ACP methyl ester carboxylesterase
MAATDTFLLHGAIGDGRQIAPLAERLTDSGVGRPVLVELPGHGTTPLGSCDFSIDGFARFVVAELDRRGVAQADFFGYSMGGYVALHLAAIAPARVHRVATLGTKLAWSPDVAAGESAMLDAATIRAKVPKFAAALEQRHTALGWEVLLTRTAELLAELGARPLLTSEVLATIEQPVRIAVGDRDATVSIAECADAVRALRSGQLEVHPATPHPIEKAPLDRIARSLGEFFA